MQIDEAIHLAAYDPAWPIVFVQERVALQPIFAPAAVVLEHIGSTAIPGLLGKPVIDVMAGLPVLAISVTQMSQLQGLGYEFLGEAGVPGRWYFRKRIPTAFNLHLVESAGEHWRNNLALRDYLRTHPAEAARYAMVKRKAYARGATTLLAYSGEKAALLGELLARALAWQEASGNTS